MSQYLEFLEEIKGEVKRAKLNAARIVNSEKIKLYFFIGQQIVEKQQRYSWRDSVVVKLSIDLKKEFGETIGFSTRNLWEMRKFYLQYKNDAILQQLVAEIPWGQNLLKKYLPKSVSNENVGD
jgi:predicted nuclease of restriction endonuclease-like (RecB) superfamily